MRHSLRIATYNVHKCRGLDGRIRPDRIADVLRELNADVLAVQEVLADQADFLAEKLEMQCALGPNRQIRGKPYGNLVLSRLPIRLTRNYDLSIRGCEARGCLRTDVEIAQRGEVHIFNVHLGTAYMERRHQGRMLITPQLVNDVALAAPRIVLGDFNEWTRGLATRLLSAHLRSADVRLHLQRRRTYPGMLPMLHLDHIYYDPSLQLVALALHRSRRALLASDHLPLVGEFQL